MDLSNHHSYAHQIVADLVLSERALKHVEFEDVVFRRCRFNGVTFLGGQFSTCRFEDCELTNVSLPGSTLNDARFERCRMMGINFADLAQVIVDIGFRECLLDYCCFAGMQLGRTAFVDCRLRDADFSGAHLEGSLFDGSDLADANFNRAVLTRADLRGTRNLCFDPRQVRLGRTRIDLDALVAIGAQLGLDVGTD